MCAAYAAYDADKFHLQRKKRACDQFFTDDASFLYSNKFGAAGKCWNDVKGKDQCPEFFQHMI